ncbi:MAG: chaperone NapD [Nitrospinae bacterium]|nr:chaperone NapD [Nitrospinota bacterium]
MNISGIVVTTDPAKTGHVIQAISAVDGAQLHKDLGDGRVVVTIEREGTGGQVAAARDIQAIDGVVSVLMAYHHFEDETADSTQPDTAAGPFAHGRESRYKS